VESYDIGKITSSNDPEQLAAIIIDMMDDHEMRAEWKKNLKEAAKELCWEKERDKLISLYQQAGLITPK
jgi:hypothetical protein